MTQPWDEGPLLPYGWRPERAGGDEEQAAAIGQRTGSLRAVVDLAGHVRLGDGTEVFLRQFGPDDGPLMAEGFARLSEQSRYRRFLAPVPYLTDSLLASLTALDGKNHRAWAAVQGERWDAAAAGLVRWVRTRNPAVADMALTVLDDYQGLGLGRVLLDAAVLDAAAHGIDRFEGLVLVENMPSRRLLAGAGATFATDSPGTLAYTLPLRFRAEALAGSPLPAVMDLRRQPDQRIA